MTPRKTPIRAAIYCRISEDRDGARAGVKRQETECRTLAEAKGWPVAEVFTDNDLSAYSGKPRPAYAQMMAAVQGGEIDAILAWHPDRLHRRPIELEEFIDVVERAGVKIATVQAGSFDLSTPSGRLVARNLGNAARYESEHKAERIRAKHREIARAGRPHGGGTRPFGYESDRLTVRKDEARLILEAARRLLGGESIRGILADWRRRKIKTPTGRDWRPNVFRDMMLSARIAGYRDHHEVGLVEGVWPAIIDRDTHDRLRVLLTDKRRRTALHDGARTYLLSGGLAACGVCGRRLVARPTQAGKRAYVCAAVGDGGCGKIRRLAEPLEELVRGAVFEAIESPKLARAIRDQKKASAETTTGRDLEQLRSDEQRLEELAKDYALGDISRAEWLAAKQAVQERIEETQRRLANGTESRILADVAGLKGRLDRAWKERGLEWRRALVAAVLEPVVVHPAVRGRSSFDPSRIEIVPRF